MTKGISYPDSTRKGTINHSNSKNLEKKFGLEDERNNWIQIWKYVLKDANESNLLSGQSFINLASDIQHLLGLTWMAASFRKKTAHFYHSIFCASLVLELWAAISITVTLCYDHFSTAAYTTVLWGVKNIQKLKQNKSQNTEVTSHVGAMRKLCCSHHLIAREFHIPCCLSSSPMGISPSWCI